MLSIDNLGVSIQGSLILRGISLRVDAGELVCLVGRNGAGKTTTFRTVMGYVRPVAGAVQFDPSHAEAIEFMLPDVSVPPTTMRWSRGYAGA